MTSTGNIGTPKKKCQKDKRGNPPNLIKVERRNKKLKMEANPVLAITLLTFSHSHLSIWIHQ
jgi:hypothetical protein